VKKEDLDPLPKKIRRKTVHT